MSKDSVRTPDFLLQRIQKDYFGSAVMFDPTPYVPVFDETKHTNGLKIDWLNFSFCNPPYSKASAFVTKACEQYLKHGIKIVMLVKVSTLASHYFQKVQNHCKVKIFNERIQFPTFRHKARFDSCLLFFGFKDEPKFEVIQL